MRHSFAVSIIVGACSLVMHNHAVADVIKLTDDATLLQQEGERYFSQSGLSGNALTPVETAGADMPLSTAVKLIIPSNWIVKTSGNFSEAVVSWTGGLVWPQIINSIAHNEGIYVHLDWVKKIASVNVPGKTKTASSHDDALAQKTSTEERQNYRKQQRQSWEKRDEQSVAIASKERQLKALEENYRKADQANQAEVAQVAKDKAKIADELAKAKVELENERQKLAALENKYAVIDAPKSSAGKQLDAVDLYKTYKERWVLPSNETFDYFKDGGHRDVISTYTPATFIAKPGTIEDVLTQWGKQVGWYVDYKASVQHQNPYEVSIKGTFMEVTKDLVSVFLRSEKPLNIEYFPDVIVDLPTGEHYKGVVMITDLKYNR